MKSAEKGQTQLSSAFRMGMQWHSDFFTSQSCFHSVFRMQKRAIEIWLQLQKFLRTQRKRAESIWAVLFAQRTCSNILTFSRLIHVSIVWQKKCHKCMQNGEKGHKNLARNFKSVWILRKRAEPNWAVLFVRRACSNILTFSHPIHVSIVWQETSQVYAECRKGAIEIWLETSKVNEFRGHAVTFWHFHIPFMFP